MFEKKIIFICNSDIFYTLPTIYNLVKNEKSLNIKVKKILVSKFKNSNNSLASRINFLINTGGYKETLLYLFFLFFKRLLYILKGVKSFNHISRKFGIEIEYVESLDRLSKKEIVSLGSEVDYGLIMIDEIINPSFISSFNKLLINKHSSLLPEGKGLFPYIRVFTESISPGVSFHEVVEEIDSGNIFFQEVVDRSETFSMTKYYEYVFNNYHIHLKKCLENIDKGIVIKNNLQTSYFSTPSKNTFKIFRNSKGKLIKFSDFLILFH